MLKKEKHHRESLKELVEDERWKKKGGPMKTKKEVDIKICECLGGDYDCPKCGGLGVIE